MSCRGKAFAEKFSNRVICNEETQQYHKISLYKVQLVRQTFFLRILCGSLDLIVIVVQSSDIDTREFDNLSCWTANTTANIQNLHVLLEAHNMGQVVFMTGNCLPERLAYRKATEME
jgi:hypothetical protein